MSAPASTTRPGTAALIIPALNEEPVIGATLASIPPHMFELVIVADNGSRDRTPDISAAAGAIVTREPERGYGATCLRALREVPDHVQAVAFMQADSSEDAREALQLLTPIYEGRADLVLGSRTLGYAEQGSLHWRQRWGNDFLILMIRLLYGHQFSDLGPFRAIRLDALRALNMRDRNYGWTVEMQVRALRAGLRIIEVPVSYRPRLAGENKVSGHWWVSVKAGLKMLWVLLALRFRS